MSDVDLLTGEEEAPPSMFALTKAQLERKFNHVIDKTKPFALYRWIFLAFELFIYFLRVYFAQGWYIVTYALGIYILNLFIGFLTPQSLESQEEEEDGLKLPTRDDEEYRPFTRRVPEFVFWWGCVKAVGIAFCLALFRLFDIPVFWPILLIYFIILFTITMKRQIQDMINRRYEPHMLHVVESYSMLYELPLYMSICGPAWAVIGCDQLASEFVRHLCGVCNVFLDLIMSNADIVHLGISRGRSPRRSTLPETFQEKLLVPTNETGLQQQPTRRLAHSTGKRCPFECLFLHFLNMHPTYRYSVASTSLHIDIPMTYQYQYYVHELQ